MYYIVGNMEQFEAFSVSCEDVIPIKVSNRLKKRVETLDSSYGSMRNLEADLGGYTVLFPAMGFEEQTERKALLEKYHASEEEFEYREEILQENEYLWIEELYILSSDFCIVFFYPMHVDKVKKGGMAE